MEENKNKQLDAFLKKQIQELPLESPKSDFTANVMDVIAQHESTPITAYKPLISGKIWFVIGAIVLAIILIPLKSLENNWFDKISFDLSFINKLSVSGLFDGLSVPATAFYGLVLFTVMIFAQVLYVKGFFKPRISSIL